LVWPEVAVQLAEAILSDTGDLERKTSAPMIASQIACGARRGEGPRGGVARCGPSG
jgi:hypothetical protein